MGLLGSTRWNETSLIFLSFSVCVASNSSAPLTSYILAPSILDFSTRLVSCTLLLEHLIWSCQGGGTILDGRWKTSISIGISCVWPPSLMISDTVHTHMSRTSFSLKVRHIRRIAPT